MRIAIQAADLDAERIDGTRVYIKNLLKYFGKLDPESEFLIYHKTKFNPELAPPVFTNYKIVTRPWPVFWTQSRLAVSLFRRKPDVLWMPMHNIPFFLPRDIKTVVTIHDLAFKYFPEMFTWKELKKLNLLAGMAVSKSDKIITISESTKSDILKFYPGISPEKVKVIHHGFERGIFEADRDQAKEKEIEEAFGIGGRYILYVGAIQPRKNLATLISAFEKLKKTGAYTDLKLVLAGGKAWMWKDVFAKIESSPFKKDMITPGKVKFSDLGHLMRGAEIFCFPSLYEGFGIPVLEAFAARVPVVCARNSSLAEVGGEAALYFDGKNAEELAENLKNILDNGELKEELIRKGAEQAAKFSWEKCARETLEYLKS